MDKAFLINSWLRSKAVISQIVLTRKNLPLSAMNSALLSWIVMILLPEEGDTLESIIRSLFTAQIKIWFSDRERAEWGLVQISEWLVAFWVTGASGGEAQAIAGGMGAVCSGAESCSKNRAPDVLPEELFPCGL